MVILPIITILVSISILLFIIINLQFQINIFYESLLHYTFYIIKLMYQMYEEHLIFSYLYFLSFKFLGHQFIFFSSVSLMITQQCQYKLIYCFTYKIIIKISIISFFSTQRSSLQFTITIFRRFYTLNWPCYITSTIPFFTSLHNIYFKSMLTFTWMMIFCYRY